MDFYNALSYLMKQKGITAAELSRRTGMAKSYFSELKAGRVKDPSWATVQTLCAALDITPNDLAKLQGYIFEDGLTHRD